MNVIFLDFDGVLDTYHYNSLEDIERKIDESTYLSMWKEDEIIKYLEMHPEIEHYCIIDDDDTKSIMHWDVSDLEKVREHLVTPLYYSDNPNEEGLLPRHKDEIARILKKKI